jgi:hypothetical protein
MKTDVSKAIKGLRTLRRLAVEGAEEGLQSLVEPTKARLEATSRHGDATGATRAGYTAYVSGPTLDGSGAVAQAAGQADAQNPGRGLAESIGDTGDAVVFVATSATDYIDTVITVRGGKMDALTGAVVGREGALLAAAANGIRRKLEG